MNISRKMAGKAEGPKLENLHVALVASLNVDARCAAATPTAVFTGDADGPLRAYSASDGQGQQFVERERDKAVNCVCVVNDNELWVGGAAGDLSVFTLGTGEKKVKPFLAHDKGVWTIVNVRGKFVVTGG
jgi:WD40 repeat protein